MNVVSKLNSMKQAPEASVMLFTGHYSEKWTADLECKKDGMELKMSVSASSPDLAVDLLWEKYQKVIGTGVPEFSPKMLGGPESTDAEFEEPPARDGSLDDNIPF